MHTLRTNNVTCIYVPIPPIIVIPCNSLSAMLLLPLIFKLAIYLYIFPSKLIPLRQSVTVFREKYTFSLLKLKKLSFLVVYVHKWHLGICGFHLFLQFPSQVYFVYLVQYNNVLSALLDVVSLPGQNSLFQLFGLLSWWKSFMQTISKHISRVNRNREGKVKREEKKKERATFRRISDGGSFLCIFDDNLLCRVVHRSKSNQASV